MSEPAEELRQVGARLRELRRYVAETQAQSAASIGISRQYVSEIEAGANITLDVVYRFAAHFDVPPASIIADDETPASNT